MLRRMRVMEPHGRLIMLRGSSTLTPAQEARVTEIRPLRVLLADGHPVVRAGLRSALARTNDLEPAGEAHDVAEAARRVVELRPDVVVLDPPAEIADAVRATRRVVFATPEKTRVVILSSRGDLPSVLAAVRAGARGYVLKGTPCDRSPAPSRCSPLLRDWTARQRHLRQPHFGHHQGDRDHQRPPRLAGHRMSGRAALRAHARHPPTRRRDHPHPRPHLEL
jgi:PleD family two-component response regulator